MIVIKFFQVSPPLQNASVIFKISDLLLAIYKKVLKPNNLRTLTSKK